MIQETPLVASIRDESIYRCIDIRLKLSPTVFEELMKNTSLSIFNDATSTTQTEVAIITYKNAYVFKDQPASSFHTQRLWAFVSCS